MSNNKEFVRPEDLLNFRVLLTNLELQDNEQLAKIDSQQDAFVTIVLPPQHIAENPYVNGKQEPPFEHEIAGSSQIVLKLIEGSIIPFTIEALLDWGEYFYPIPDSVLSPDSEQTRFEMPTRLALKPEDKFIWFHSPTAISHNDVVELWHTRLLPLDKGRTSIDFFAIKPASELAFQDTFERIPDASIRRQLIKLTSAQENAIEGSNILLSPLGATFEFGFIWEDPESSDALEWQQRAQIGRDNFGRQEQTGILLPFGIEVKIEDIYERQVIDGMAYFVRVQRRIYCNTNKLEYHTGKLAGFDISAHQRQNPFRSIQCRTSVANFTQKLQFRDDVESPDLFVPLVSVDGEPFQFEFFVEDYGGRTFTFFATQVVATSSYQKDYIKDQNDADTFNSLYFSFVKEISQISTNGERISFAPRRNTNASESVAFETYFLQFKITIVGDGAIYPVMNEAEIAVQETSQVLEQNPRQHIKYLDNYLDWGFIEDRSPEVYLELKSSIVVKLPQGVSIFPSSSMTGILPSMGQISTIARDKGPVVGDVTNILKNDPQIVNLGKSMANQYRKEIKSNGVHGFADDILDDITDEIVILGGIKLKDLIADELDSIDDLPSFLRETDYFEPLLSDPDRINIPSEIVLTYTWKPKLKSNNIISFDNDYPLSAFGTARLKLYDLDQYLQIIPNGNREFLLDATLNGVTLSLFGIIKIKFKYLTYSLKNDKEPEFNFEIDFIEFEGALGFFADLASKFSTDLFGDNAPVLPVIEIDGSGVSAGLAFDLPDVELGSFALTDVNFGAQIYLPFSEGALACRFNFGRPDRVFFITVGLFGGGGYFLLDINKDGIARLGAALEIGALKQARVFGAASAYLKISVGIYYRRISDGDWTFSGYLDAIGEVDVRGVLGVSAEFKLSITYDGHSAVARGRFKVRVKLACFGKVSVSLRYETKFPGSIVGSRSKARKRIRRARQGRTSLISRRRLKLRKRKDMIPEDPVFNPDTWLIYTTAFAPDST